MKALEDLKDLEELENLKDFEELENLEEFVLIVEISQKQDKPIEFWCLYISSKFWKPRTNLA